MWSAVFALVVSGAAQAETLGGYTFVPASSATLVNAPGGSWGWVNLSNTYISVDDALTSSPVSQAGYVNCSTGATVDWGFPGGVTNNPGPDIVYFDLHYDFGHLDASTDYDGFVAQYEIGNWADTLVGGAYWFEGAGPYPATLWSGTVDLSDLGVPDGAVVYTVRTVALDEAVDPAGMGAIGDGEACDGIDNDGDGGVDEGFPDTDGDGLADCVDPCPTVVGGSGVDGDGDGDPSCTDCDDADATVDSVDADGDTWASCDGDCDDTNDLVFPGATEQANGIDDDCDQAVDEGTIWYDDDGDGFTEDGGDCNDGDAAISPNAVEVCDGIDNDCDGAVDEDTECTDDDGDGWCEGPACVDGSTPGDCNDADAATSPDGLEIPGNGIDDDCDPLTVDGYEDEDGDGFAVEAGDCDDTDATVFPGAPELADGVDNDCDGTVDEGTALYDDDGDGFTEADGDCNDADPAVFPGAADVQNGVDDDCDGTVDEGTDFTDDDGDGFSEADGDCDDLDAAANPGAPEVENGVDDNCNGQVDEGFEDLDDDGYTVADGDCRDDLGWVNPGRAEQCDDALDNDCNGEIDEGCEASAPVDDKASDCGCQAAPSGPFAGALLVLLGALSRRRARA